MIYFMLTVDALLLLHVISLMLHMLYFCNIRLTKWYFWSTLCCTCLISCYLWLSWCYLWYIFVSYALLFVAYVVLYVKPYLLLLHMLTLCYLWLYFQWVHSWDENIFSWGQHLSLVYIWIHLFTFVLNVQESTVVYICV